MNLQYDLHNSIHFIEFVKAVQHIKYCKFYEYLYIVMRYLCSDEEMVMLVSALHV